MGYTTDFSGEFTLNKPLDKKTMTFLIKFNETRRMKRKFPDDKYGIDGEFFVDGTGCMGQDNDATVVDHNTHPSTQPGLWCGWRPNDEGTAIVWDGGEKFYHYVEWIQYIITNFLAPKGYILTGDVRWEGEDSDDVGIIRIVNNVVTAHSGQMTFPSLEPVDAQPVQSGVAPEISIPGRRRLTLGD